MEIKDEMAKRQKTRSEESEEQMVAGSQHDHKISPKNFKRKLAEARYLRPPVIFHKQLTFYGCVRLQRKFRVEKNTAADGVEEIKSWLDFGVGRPVQGRGQLRLFQSISHF